MKRKLLTIQILGLILLSGLQAEVLLKIPVRVYENGKYITNLKPGDFDLEINGVKRIVERVEERDRNLGVTEHSRTYVLHFDLTEYGATMIKGITYFVDNILSKKDNIILWTPAKIYRINTNQNKLRVIRDIETLVKNDSLTYKSIRKGAKDKLTAVINGFLNSRPNSRDPGNLVTAIIFFLNNYSREWLDFKKKFIVPNMGKYYSLISMLTYKYPGEKYFITFQQREIMPSAKRYNEAKRVISNYLSSIAGTMEAVNSASITTGLKTIDQSMLLTDNFDPDLLTAPFLGGNISFNVIFFNSFRQSGEDADDRSPDYEGVLRDLSMKTGGMSVNTNDLEEGLGMTRKKQDHYYNIIYRFDGKPGEKRITIRIPGKKYDLWYLNKFHKEEIENLVKRSMEKKIFISDFSLRDHALTFQVGGFRIDGKQDKIGIVKILIELLDKENSPVFSKSNTLRASKDSIGISLNLAPEKKGYFKLRISAEDMKASRTARFEQYVQLK